MKQNKINDGHYQGFWIDWYDDLLKGEISDLNFYTGILEPSDGPVLELACGTGRMMLALMDKGIETHGLDISEPMLEICRKKLSGQVFDTVLYRQDVTDMKLSQTYPTIIASGGSFQLVSTHDQALKALENIFASLDENGRFICDLWIPWDELIANEQRTWKVGRVAERPDGTRMVVSYYKEFYHREQMQHGLFKYEMFDGPLLVDTHLDELKLSWFGVREFELMLEKTGFTDIRSERQPIMSSHGISTVYFAKKINP